MPQVKQGVLEVQLIIILNNQFWNNELRLQLISMIDSAQEESKDRPYICPCGKNYLSYPALFTHIKQKHQGTPPGEIIRPKATNKRGRPRKYVNDPLNDVCSPPQHKNPIERYFGGEDDEENYQMLIKEAQTIKKQFKPTFDFRPPITFSSLQPKPDLTPQQNEPAPVKAQFKGQLPHPLLKLKLKAIFEENSPNDCFLDTKSVEQLTSANKCYQSEREGEPCRSRRPIGIDQWQMELRTALFQFLDWAEMILTFWQFKNTELLVALLILFFTKMVPDCRPFSTVNYLVYLNSFTKSLLLEAKQDGFYKNVFILHKQVPLKLLAVIHEWFVLEGLSYHQLKINPSFLAEQQQPDAINFLKKNHQQCS